MQEESEISRMKVVPKPDSKMNNDNAGIPDQGRGISGLEIHTKGTVHKNCRFEGEISVKKKVID